jgi:uncharacterized protein (TIGR03435 family)
MLSRTIRTTVCAAATMLVGVDAPCQKIDLATIKPHPAGKSGSGVEASPGMLTMRSLSLSMIIGAAYGIAEYQISGPPWLKQERFDITAKLDTPVADKDEMLPLLQPLLAERFRLAFHHETKQLPAYVLTVGKNGSKLEAANDGGAELPFKKANKSGGTRIHSAHLTMPQFAELLSRRLGRPVKDMTGLTGAYRVNLEWAADDTREKPSKPDKAQRDKDGPSIVTALQEQMGLRLEVRKAPVEILVIDHVDKNPTAN